MICHVNDWCLLFSRIEISDRDMKKKVVFVFKCHLTNVWIQISRNRYHFHVSLSFLHSPLSAKEIILELVQDSSVYFVSLLEASGIYCLFSIQVPKLLLQLLNQMVLTKQNSTEVLAGMMDLKSGRRLSNLYFTKKCIGWLQACHWAFGNSEFNCDITVDPSDHHISDISMHT